MIESQSDKQAGGTLTVLVVDDQPEILRTLSRYLGARGYRVETVTSVDEAIPMLHAGVRAVVLDVRMPRQSGLELLEFIRRDDRLRELPDWRGSDARRGSRDCASSGVCLLQAQELRTARRLSRSAHRPACEPLRVASTATPAPASWPLRAVGYARSSPPPT